jgi:hypothetical protein
MNSPLTVQTSPSLSRESATPRRKNAVISLALFLLVECSLTCCGFVLIYDNIDRQGHNQLFSWNEYVIQSMYGMFIIPSSCFDLVLGSFIKNIILLMALLVIRYNYRLRKLSWPKIAIYAAILIPFLYTLRKLARIYNMNNVDTVLPVPIPWAYGMTGGFLGFTLIQGIMASTLLKSWIVKLDEDMIREGYVPTPRLSPIDSMVGERIPWALIGSLLKPELKNIILATTMLVLNSATQLAMVSLFQNLIVVALRLWASGGRHFQF